MKEATLVGVSMLILCFGSALADGKRIGPSYGCHAAAYADGLTRMICERSDLSREEMSFAQVYFARKFLVGESGKRVLKDESRVVSASIRNTCGMPKEGAADQTMPANAATCYVAETEKYRRRWLQSLHGGVLEEAARPVEQNLALQQRLVDRGYLPPNTVVDGVFGEGTRTAIMTWQRSAGRNSTSGFLSDYDAGLLLAPTSSDGAPPPSESQTPLEAVSAQPVTSAKPKTTRPLPPVAAAVEPQTVPKAVIPQNSMTIIDFLTDAANLDGQHVAVLGLAYCLKTTFCKIYWKDRHFYFDATNLSRNIRKKLLLCDNDANLCVVVLSGIGSFKSDPTVDASDMAFVN